MRDITVALEVKRVVLNLSVEDTATDKEILDLAKKEFLKQASTKFPGVTYSISDGDILDFSNVYVGKVVKDAPNGSYGIVIKINPKTIVVSFQKGLLKGHPSAFSPAEEKINPDKIMWERHKSHKDMGFWSDGNVAYLADKKEKKVVPVVLVKVTSGGKYQFFRINEKSNTYYNLPENYLKTMVFDTKKEAKANL